MSNEQTHSLPNVGDIVKGYTVKGYETTKPKRFPGYNMPSITYLFLQNEKTNKKRIVRFDQKTGRVSDFEKVEFGYKKGQTYKTW